MEVILLKSIEKLGRFGEVVKVKKGYARNFLIPQKFAQIANKKNLDELENRKNQLLLENEKLKQQAEKAKELLGDLRVFLLHQASEDGKLYGTVHAKDIVAYIKDKHGFLLEKSQIRISSKIKDLGIYTFEIELHMEVLLSAMLVVSRTEQEGVKLLDEFLESKRREEKKDLGNEHDKDAINKA